MSIFARVWKGDMAAPTAMSTFQTRTADLRIPADPRARRAEHAALLQRLAQPATSDSDAARLPAYEH